MGAQPVAGRLEGIKAHCNILQLLHSDPRVFGLPCSVLQRAVATAAPGADPSLPQYPLPAPQGGKHANNPHLVEDQRFPQQRLSRKARQKTNVFDPDYLAGASPFAENDVHSRAAHLHLRDAALGAGRRRLNPNAVTKKFVRRR